MVVLKRASRSGICFAVHRVMNRFQQSAAIQISMTAIYRQFLSLLAASIVILALGGAQRALGTESEGSGEASCNNLIGPPAHLLDVPADRIKRTIGIAVQDDGGSTHLLVGHYVHSSHEWLYQKARERWKNLKVLWGGEMEWRRTDEGQLSLHRWNDTSGFVFELFSQLPDQEKQQRLEIVLDHFRRQQKFDVSDSKRVLYSTRSPHLSEELNRLVAIAGGGAVRHSAISTLTALYSFIENLKLLRDRGEPELLTRLFKEDRENIYLDLLRKTQLIFDWLKVEGHESLTSFEGDDLEQAIQYLNEGPKGRQWFFNLYEDPKAFDLYKRVIHLVSKHLKGGQGLRSKGYLVFDDLSRP